MARRAISKVGGFVHDINTVASLSDVPNNIRLLSDRSLYILQNLSSEDVTFLSRYGEILEGNFYLPVTSGSPEEDDVVSAVDLIRRDLNSMGVEELLECICSGTNTLVEQGAVAGQAVNDIASDGTVLTGPDEQFPDQASYFDAKCNVANAIFDTVLGLVDWLDDNDVDLIAGLFGGITSGLLVAVALAGPVGWAWIVVGAVVTGIASYIVRLTVNFSDLSDALGDTHDECVLGLYNSSNTVTAAASFIAAVEAGSPAITSVESGLLSLFLVSDLLNNLFSPRDDIVYYVSPSPVDCGSAILASWTFPVGVEGWVFRDDSNGASSASGVWNAVDLALQVTMNNAGGPSKPMSRGTWVKTGLAIAVPVSASVQFDYSAPSDGINQSKHIKIIYDDLSESNKTVTGGTDAGTLVITLPAAKTIEEIECSISRTTSGVNSHTSDVQEVRVIGT